MYLFSERYFASDIYVSNENWEWTTLLLSKVHVQRPPSFACEFVYYRIFIQVSVELEKMELPQYFVIRISLHAGLVFSLNCRIIFYVQFKLVTSH